MAFFLNLKDATSFFEIVDTAFVQLSLLTHQLHSQLIFIRNCCSNSTAQNDFFQFGTCITFVSEFSLRADITLFLYSSLV
jgi:hypothetical protein